MNFYKHYIGDFQRDTSHLSLTERGAYLALIHHYYATETPLPTSLDALYRIAGAVTRLERDAVKAIICFFEQVESGLMHIRIEAEIDKAGEISNTNRSIALAREAKRRADKDTRTEHEACTKRAKSVVRTEHEQSTNQTPDTRHQLKPNPLTPFAQTSFPRYWVPFPNKKSKGQAEKVWIKLNPDEELILAILAGLERAKLSEQWINNDGKYIPHPATWLRARGWEDVYPDENEDWRKEVIYDCSSPA